MFSNSFYSNTDTIFVWHVCKFLYYIGLIPFNPTKRDHIIQFSRKIYIIILQILSILVACLALYGRTLHFKSIRKIFVGYLQITADILLLLIASFSFIGTNFFNANNWNQVFDTILEMEGYFYIKLDSKKTIKSYYLKFLPAVLFVIIITLFDMITAYGENYSIFENLRFILFHFVTLIAVSQLMLIIIILMFIKRRYKCLNECLRKCFQNQKSEANIIGELRKITKIYQKINNLIFEFNNIFGWFLLFYFAYFVLITVLWQYILIFDNLTSLQIFSYIIYSLTHTVR